MQVIIRRNNRTHSNNKFTIKFFRKFFLTYNFLSYSAAEPQPITSETAKDAFKINQPNTTTKQQGNEEGGKQDAQNAN